MYIRFLYIHITYTILYICVEHLKRSKPCSFKWVSWPMTFSLISHLHVLMPFTFNSRMWMHSLAVIFLMGFFCWRSAVWWTSCLLPNHVLTGQFIQFKTLFRCPDFVLENVCVLPLMCQTASVICQVVAAHPPQQPPPRFLADMETHSRTHRYV